MHFGIRENDTCLEGKAGVVDVMCHCVMALMQLMLLLQLKLLAQLMLLPIVTFQQYQRKASE
eukprot:14744094-Ditylum_brightwellii.AAC.1